jgi:hypothetical protein
MIRYSTYTFVIEFLGGTYVRQGGGESPEVALRTWLRLSGEGELEWAQYRDDLLRALRNQTAVPIEGCRNVWCMSGLAGEHLFLIHIVGTDLGPAAGKTLALAQRIEADTGTFGRRSFR